MKAEITILPEELVQIVKEYLETKCNFSLSVNMENLNKDLPTIKVIIDLLKNVKEGTICDSRLVWTPKRSKK